MGDPGAMGDPGVQGAAGMGAMGTMGTAGQSVVVSAESPGANCTYGGAKLASGGGSAYVCNGAPAVVAYGYFFARMPADNAATVAVGSSVQFPVDGPMSGITRMNATTFVLPAIGVYEVSWQVSVTEAGQLVLALNGVELTETVVGRATGTSQLVGHALITTTTASSTVAVRNPAGESTALTITPLAGGTSSVTAGLVIKRIS
ncbi:MAG: hypothetical protein JWN44_6458 [Myxococcales bacterium]|nr:hypothetical protein [Myxococcales bacterium]